MLFNPLRQIADKFNEMQLGMIAANRVFAIIDTADQIQDTGTVEAPFSMVIFISRTSILATSLMKRL
jgi:ABC-type multidrug transport system fused ATPase/permease subunit